MNRRTFLASSIATAASAASPTPLAVAGALEKAAAWIGHVSCSFAMAYYLGPLDDRDKRPTASVDPFAKNPPSEEIPDLRILRSEKTGEIDTAKLIASATHRVRVPPEKLAALVGALLDSDIVAPVADCYEPHHVVICYNELGAPCGVIEICLSCVAFRIFPGGQIVRSDLYDIVQAARVLHDLGLPLNRNNMPLDAYAQDIQKRIKSQ